MVTFFLPLAVTLLHALESNANLAGFAETKPVRLPRVALHRARGLRAPCAQLIVLHLHDHKRLVRCPRLLRNPGPAPTTSCAHNATTSCVDARTTAHDRANLALAPVAVASGCGQRHARVRSRTRTRAQPLRRSARWLGPAALRRTFCFGARPHPLLPVHRFSGASTRSAGAARWAGTGGADDRGEHSPDDSPPAKRCKGNKRPTLALSGTDETVGPAHYEVLWALQGCEFSIDKRAHRWARRFWPFFGPRERTLRPASSASCLCSTCLRTCFGSFPCKCGRR